MWIPWSCLWIGFSIQENGTTCGDDGIEHFNVCYHVRAGRRGVYAWPQAQRIAWQTLGNLPRNHRTSVTWISWTFERRGRNQASVLQKLTADIHSHLRSHVGDPQAKTWALWTARWMRMLTIKVIFAGWKWESRICWLTYNVSQTSSWLHLWRSAWPSHQGGTMYLRALLSSSQL